MYEGKVVVSVRDQIARKLRNDIIDGTLSESEKLKEQELAQRFGVSRGPIRDVLLQLTKEGLLTSKPNCGVSVNTALNPHMQTLMVELRTEIEMHALRSSIDTLTDKDFDELSGCLSALIDAFNEENYTLVTELDMSFHRYFVQKAGGSDLVNIWEPIVYRMRMNYRRIDNADDCFTEHNRILNAMMDRDIEEAIAALQANIR